MRSNNSKAIPKFVKKAVFVASLGGILFGYDMGVVSAALPQLRNEFELNEAQEGMIVSFLFLGGAVGAGIGGTLCDTAGRKKAIIITDAVFLIGAISLFVSQTFLELLIGRFVVGFAVAVSGIADVAYLHEISPVEWRGSIVSVNEACISFGFLVSYLAGYGITRWVEHDGWRYMFGAGGFISLLQLVGMRFMPESPVWLQDKGRTEEAKIVLALIGYHDDDNNNTNSDHDFTLNDKKSENETVEDYGLEESGCNRRQRSSSSQHLASPNNSFEKSSPMHEVNYASMNLEGDGNKDLTSPQNEFLASYRQMIIAAFLSIMQQFCGHSNVLNYAPEIFAEVGVASLSSTVLLGVLKFIITCFVIWKIEYFGRKLVLLLGMSIISISLLFLLIAFTSQDEEGNMPKFSQVLAITGVFGVVGGYACSFGPLTWLLVSELFQSSIRGRALGAATIITYLAGAIVSYWFLTVQKSVGAWVPFACYYILTLLSIFFVVVAIPDTAGKDPISIQNELVELWFWRKGNLKKIKKSTLHELSADSTHEII